MNFRDLSALVAQRRAEFERIAAQAPDSVYGKVSDTWKGFLKDRPNFISAEEFNTFRSPRTGATFGVGDAKESAVDRKLFNQSMTEIFERWHVPEHVIAEIAEPLLGAPEVFAYRGNLISHNYLRQAVTSWRIAELAAQHGVTSKPWRVCEIGAGFGARAVALHQLHAIESYTIIDIPENLYLSSIFVPMSLPGLVHNFVDPDKPASFDGKARLNFMLPSFCDDFRLRDFDLVINTASLGEMPLATAQAYVAWLGERLSPTGVFYSANRWNVGKAAGAQTMGDFGIHNLAIRHFEAAPLASRPANQLGHRILAAKRAQPSPIDRLSFDAVGDLIACGFDEEIKEIAQAVVRGEESKDVRRALHAFAAFFRPAPAATKRRLLSDATFPALENAALILGTVLDLIGSDVGDMRGRKAALLALPLGRQMDFRLRALFAEVEKLRGRDDWRATLAPIESYAPALHEMVIRDLSLDKRPMSAALMRDMKVS